MRLMLARADGPVSDDDDDAATQTDLQDGAVERRVTLGVEVRVRFVEHDQERLAVECTGQRNTLALADGQRFAMAADVGLVAVGEAEDQIVHAGRPGRRDDRCGRRIRIEPRNVLGDGAGHQFDVLRQVSDVTAALGRRPLCQCSAVQRDLATQWLGGAGR